MAALGRPGYINLGHSDDLAHANWEIEAKAHEVKEQTLARLERQWPESLALLDSYLSVYWTARSKLVWN